MDLMETSKVVRLRGEDAAACWPTVTETDAGRA